MSKTYVYLRLFKAGEDLPCACATVDVEVTPNGVSYNVHDLDTLRAPLFASALQSNQRYWQQIADVICTAANSDCPPTAVSKKIDIDGGFQLTWRKLT